MILAAKAASASGAPSLPYLWITVGASGVLRTSTSTSADSWTTQTSSFSTSTIYDVASDGKGLYVAVGASGKIATSPDGTSWTQQTSSFSTTNVRAVAYGDNIWVAVGDSGKIATSPDGITWTQRTSGTASSLRAVAYGNGLFVCGYGSVMRTAPDPTSTWTSRTSTLTGLDANGIHYAKAQGIWVAGGDGGTTGAFASSTDGTTWTARNSASSYVSGIACFTSTSSVIASGGCTSVSPINCDVQSSTDGTTWTDRTPADGSGDGIYAAAVDNNDFMVMAGTKIQSTSDGINYTDRGSSGFASFNLTSICHSAGKPSIR